MNHATDNDPIRTVSDLVAAFGGTGAVAEWLDVGSPCVSNWKALGQIPRGYHLQIYLEAKRRGIRICSSLFGMPPELFKPANHECEASA